MICSQTEFLLSGPGSLGIFVNVNGASQRPPIALSPNLSSVFCRQSLIFAIDDEFISIHRYEDWLCYLKCLTLLFSLFWCTFSVANQKQLQTLVLPGVTAVCRSLNRNMIFLVSEGDRIYTLASETWDQQARRLVLAGCTQEATELITQEFAKLTALCNECPATSSCAKSVFNAVNIYSLTLSWHWVILLLFS